MARRKRSRFLRQHPHLAPLVVLLKAFVAIWIVIAFGSVGYHVIEGWPALDSFYMTMITLTTIGFGEIYPLSPAGRIFTVVIIFLSESNGTSARRWKRPARRSSIPSLRSATRTATSR